MELVFNYLLLPLLIFLARVADVSLETVRIIFVSKGYKFISLFIGFFEVLIWLTAINQLLSDLSNFWLYLAYAGGFAIGTWAGIWIEDKISLGHAMVRIIIRKNSKKLINELNKNHYQLTVLDGQNGDEETDVKMIFSVIKRKELKKMFEILKRINPKAFYTVEDIRSTRQNEFFVVGEKKKKGKLF